MSRIKYSNKDIPISYTSKNLDIEQDAKDELSSIMNSKRKAEQKKAEQNTNANFFTVISFNNEAQLDEFIKKTGLKIEDKQYINGLSLCKKLGIEIKTESNPAPGKFKVNKKLTGLTI